MESQILVPLNQIDPNPYQPRQVEDAAAVAEIAESIKHNGLMQVPTARQGDGRYQLAFGHTRLAAFKLNGEECMPLIIRHLSDLQMFELGVAENIKRRDLNPIEQAVSMRRYMDEFGKTSVEAGAFFNVSPEKVRGTLRYLNLPEPVQVKLAAGEINQDAARRLLTIARVDPKQVEISADRMATGSSAEEAIEMAMHQSDSAFVMWFSFNKEKPHAGHGLWPIEMGPDKFPMKQLPTLTVGDAAKALGIELTDQSKREIKSWIDAFAEKSAQLGGGHWFNGPGGSHKIEGDVAQFLIDRGAPADQIERIAHLLTPPGCSVCPFHAVADNQHYCGFKPCHQRKRKAWMADEVERSSKKLKIAVYDSEEDGKTVLVLEENTYQDNYKKHAELVKKQEPDLRIQAHYNEYSKHKWTESHLCRVILVGKKATTAKEAAKEKKNNGNDSFSAQQKAREQEWQLRQALRDASIKFTDNYSDAFFAAAFKDLEHVPAMCALARVGSPKKDAKKAELLADLRRRIANRALDNLNGYGWDLFAKGPTSTAKYLQKVATTWGIKLPADFLDVAKGFEPVTAETPKKGKKA